ncbi:hypothetical protein CEXT_241601 [Caerostris extrusa]|uniref:Uncharacterized protein n=1 Tax=Caerostris extrusa TaxID=172846 RepID=A0AAV4P5R9_CAEEX|nr:hypothetical protein CEXT_241601 [Caerostris extrusa]
MRTLYAIPEDDSKSTRFYGEENSLCSPSFLLFFMFLAKSSIADEEVGFYTSLSLFWNAAAHTSKLGRTIHLQQAMVFFFTFIASLKV